MSEEKNPRKFPVQSRPVCKRLEKKGERHNKKLCFFPNSHSKDIKMLVSLTIKQNFLYASEHGQTTWRTREKQKKTRGKIVRRAGRWMKTKDFFPKDKNYAYVSSSEGGGGEAL